MICAMYLRKSRADYEAEARGEGETLAKHRETLMAVAKARDLTVTDVFAELVSGDTIAERPEMQRLMRAVERGETAALRSGASIDSVRTVVVNGPPDSKTPEAFLISDTVTYPDGHVESIHHSFANIGYAEQAEMEAISASLPDAIDAPNPGDALRASLSPESYAELMEATDAELPSIADTYASADFSGALPEPDTASGDPECSADADSRTDSSAAPDAAAEAEADSDPDPDPD